MRDHRTSLLILGTLTLLYVVHMVYGLSDQPGPMATHFGSGGRPNGWMSNSAFLLFGAALWATMVACFWTLRPLLRRVKPSLVNIPHKAWWLDPVRREETIATAGAWMESMGVVTLIGLFGLNECLFLANRRPEVELGTEFIVGIVVYLVITLVWSVAFIRMWRNPG